MGNKSWWSALELKVSPPLVVIFSGALAFGLAAGQWAPLRLGLTARCGLGLALAGVGLAIILSAGRLFLKNKTTWKPRQPDKSAALVVAGIYRHTRNPMYLGMLLVLSGWVVALGDALGFAGCLFLVGYLTRFQIIPEERFLAAKFGADYLAYQRRVRRWI